ncbi:MAG: hypothetical protein C5B59_05560 [Bacteroidetes bacterium]|nr:MAG: hypothetical protein C5B59_05560 [Bacteroidota bacterium]
MKRIKNNHHLQEQRLALRVREFELEKSLRKDWKELKEKWNPSTALENSKHSHWLTELLQVASASLTRKILEKAEEKIEESSNKGIEFLNHRILHLQNKRK